MGGNDQHVAHADADRTARLMLGPPFDGEVDALDVGHRESRQNCVPVEVTDVRSEHVGHIEAFREHTEASCCSSIIQPRTTSWSTRTSGDSREITSTSMSSDGTCPA